MSFKNISDYNIKNIRKKNRYYDINPIDNGDIFLVTVNSNKAIDLETLEYRDGNTLINYDTTVEGIKKVGKLLKETTTNNLEIYENTPKIKNFSIEVGRKNLRLHTHFSVYVPHAGTHATFQLDRDIISSVFKSSWGIPEDENIHVNIKQALYSPETETRFSDYMNQYVGPNLGEQGLKQVNHKKPL